MRNTRRIPLATALVVTTTTVLGQGIVGPKVKFTKSRFDAAQQAGRSILVEVSAPRCLACKLQRAINDSFVAKPEFMSAALFEVEFDSQKDVPARFDVRRQSTLIAFKGRSEMNRSTGETKVGAVETILETTI
jgi:thioredoxin 1